MTHFFSQTVWLVPCYAIFGIICSIAWSPGLIRRTGPRPAGYINTALTFLGFFHSLLALREVWNQPPSYESFLWLQAADLRLALDLEISAVTVGALVLITGLNCAANIFAIGYMEMDWGWARFFSLLSFFEAGMCSLVLCNSLFFSYVVLEILTLGTYMLIGLWFNQSLVVTGARDAFLTKRVGDLFLLMGVVALLPLSGTWNFQELGEWAKTATVDPTVLTLITLALIAGPLGKCAQFPLHLWLDEAMEGPVPATILRNTVVVSTGAWVLIKLQPVFAMSSVASTAMIWIGSVTAVGAATIAIAQIDVKRSLSYSVSAYMGIIFIAVGTQQDETALVLLLTYSVAMAILVMSIGGIVWNNITQDLTKYGGLWSRRPISGLCYLVGTVSIVSLPPFGCFWAFSQLANDVWKAGYPGLVGVMVMVNALTAFSTSREFCTIFGGKPTPMTVRSPEGLWPLVLPMTITTGVALHLPLILQRLGLLPALDTILTPVTAVLVLGAIAGAGSAAYIYLNDNIKKPIQLPLKGVQDFFARDLYTAELYRYTVIFAVGIVSNLIYWVDRFIVDGLVNLVGIATNFSGQTLKYNVSGQTQFYVLSILLGVAVLGITICYPFLANINVVFGS